MRAYRARFERVYRDLIQRATAFEEETPEHLRRRADVIESRECTGLAASWCPVHGDCLCPRAPDGEPLPSAWYGERSLDDPGCPLHAPGSSHASGLAFAPLVEGSTILCPACGAEVARVVRTLDHGDVLDGDAFEWLIRRFVSGDPAICPVCRVANFLAPVRIEGGAAPNVRAPA